MLQTSIDMVRARLVVALLLAGLAGCSTAPPDRPEKAQSAALSEAPSAPAEQLPPVEVPERAQLSFQRAVDAMRRGDVTEAELELEQLTLAYPDFAGPQVNLAIIYRQSGRIEAAEAALKKALVLNPSHAEAFNQLGIVMRQQGRFEEAEQAYRDALAVRPDYALAHYNLGVLLDLYLKRPDEALPHYQRYQELSPEPDKMVGKWIIDLQRRLGVIKTTTRVAQEDAP